MRLLKKIENKEKGGLRNKFLDLMYEKYEEEGDFYSYIDKNKIGIFIERKGGEFLEGGIGQIIRRRYR